VNVLLFAAAVRALLNASVDSLWNGKRFDLWFFHAPQLSMQSASRQTLFYTFLHKRLEVPAQQVYFTKCYSL
jgi:hypothetical protein